MVGVWHGCGGCQGPYLVHGEQKREGSECGGSGTLHDYHTDLGGKPQQQQQQQQLGNKVGEINSEFCQTCRKNKSLPLRDATADLIYSFLHFTAQRWEPGAHLKGCLTSLLIQKLCKSPQS